MDAESRKLLVNGLWHNNPALVQILGLCPLLAVSNTFINALGLGIATIFVLSLSNSLVSLSRRWLSNEIRIPVFVLLIAAAVTLCELIIQAFAYSLYQSLGIYLSLIVTNCVIIARAEAYAVKNSLKYAALDGLFMGIGFAIILILLGAIREILTQGTLFSGANLLFGSAAADWTWQVIDIQNGMTLAALPAGAFICYGFLVAGKQALDTLFKKRS